MIDLRRAGPPAPVFVVLLLTSVLVAACSGAATDATASGPASDPPSAAPSAASTPDGAPSDAPSAATSEAPGQASPAGENMDPETPTACLTLGPQDCERARALAATTLTAADPPAKYIQVGPFGCSVGERCPPNLVARPEGDVVIEFGDGQGVNVHLKVAADGSFAATRGAAMGVPVAPVSVGPIPVGPIEFTLGHCGVFSGIDLGGHWWDPVGPLPMDSGDAVNATPGVIVVNDPTHATFTSPGGFALQLLRRDGQKLLPFCM
jgi:hypothetical protein